MLLVRSKRCQSTVLLVEFSESDVSPLLSQLIKIIPPGYSTCPNLNYLTENSTLLSISNNACNSDSLTMFDLSVYVKLVSVIVGDEEYVFEVLNMIVKKTKELLPEAEVDSESFIVEL